MLSSLVYLWLKDSCTIPLITIKKSTLHSLFFEEFNSNYYLWLQCIIINTFTGCLVLFQFCFSKQWKSLRRNLPISRALYRLSKFQHEWKKKSIRKTITKSNTTSILFFLTSLYLFDSFWICFEFVQLVWFVSNAFFRFSFIVDIVWYFIATKFYPLHVGWMVLTFSKSITSTALDFSIVQLK